MGHSSLKLNPIFIRCIAFQTQRNRKNIAHTSPVFVYRWALIGVKRKEASKKEQGGLLIGREGMSLKAVWSPQASGLLRSLSSVRAAWCVGSGRAALLVRPLSESHRLYSQDKVTHTGQVRSLWKI